MTTTFADGGAVETLLREVADGALPSGDAMAGTQLRTKSLQDAFLQAARVAEPAGIERTVHIARACAESRAVVTTATVLLALTILLITRPPFVLRFEHDARRPWKGVMRVSWLAVMFTVLIAAAAAVGLPLLAQFAEVGSP